MAMIDGASRYRIFWSIVLPLATPASPPPSSWS